MNAAWFVFGVMVAGGFYLVGASVEDPAVKVVCWLCSASVGVIAVEHLLMMGAS